MGVSKWTKGDDETLLKMLKDGESVADMAIVLGRTKLSIMARANKLGIGLSATEGIFSSLTYKDKKFVSLNKDFLSPQEISDKIGKSVDEISNYIKHLGKSNKKNIDKQKSESKFHYDEIKNVYNDVSTVLNKFDLKYVETYYKTKDVNEIAENLNKPKEYIYNEILRLKNVDESENSWTDEQIAYLKKNRKSMLYCEIAKELGKKTYTVAEKAKELGVDGKPKVYKKKEKNKRDNRTLEDAKKITSFVDDEPYSVRREQLRKKLEEIDKECDIAMKEKRYEDALRLNGEINELQLKLQSFRFSDDFNNGGDDVLMDVYKI